MAHYRVRHYWKEGASSTWEADKGLNQDVFEYLKKNYQSFVEERPKYRLYKNYKISFEYEDTKDSFGRAITNITFNISKVREGISKNIKYLIVLFLLVILILVITNQKKNNPKSNANNISSNQNEEKSRDKKNKWSDFKNNWNDKINKDDDKFKLKNDGHKYIIKKFNEWLTHFSDFKKIDSNISFNDFEVKIKRITKVKTLAECVDEIRKNN